jgi:fibronectin-binding autotransporter adhesin
MDMATRHHEQRLFVTTGTRHGEGVDAIDGLGLWPAVFARYRDLTRLRYDFPLVLVDHGPGAGTLGITKNGAGQQTLSGVNNYAGPTTINNGALVAGSTTAFSGASAYNLTAAGATLDLATFNNSIFSLTGVAGSIVKDTGGVGATLTITNGGGANFAGNMIDNGPLALHKSGPGTQILSGINTYSGDTIIDGGILHFSASGS